MMSTGSRHSSPSSSLDQEVQRPLSLISDCESSTAMATSSTNKNKKKKLKKKNQQPPKTNTQITPPDIPSLTLNDCPNSLTQNVEQVASASVSASASSGKSKKKNKHKKKTQQQQQSQPPVTPNTQIVIPEIPSLNLDDCPNPLRENLEKVAEATVAAYTFLCENDLKLHPSQILALESKIASTARSLDKLNVSLPSPSSSSSSKGKKQDWFHRFLSDAADDYDKRWTDWFRMSKTSFTLLLSLVKSSLSSLAPLQPKYALAAALFRLAHSATYKSVGNRFGIDSPKACLAFHTVVKAIVENLGHLFELKSDINRIVVGFGWISLPNCCGALGFDRFKVEGNVMGENGYALAQALVDSEGRFLDVSAGWPSTLKPESILRQTEFYTRVEEAKELLNGPPFELKDGNLVPQYILGEPCFPLLPWLITPFVETDDMDATRKEFNQVHKNAMKLVDTAFGRVKDQWQLLKKEWKEGAIEALPFVIVACCLLHNFLIKCSELAPDNNVEYSRDFELPDFEGELDEKGSRIRYALAVHLNRVSQSK